jgi:excinuclease UvrABC nuclease subunit
MIGLNYRSPIGGKIVFADWLNDLRSSSGAYVIRSRSTKQIFYVGESHTGRLASTIKRHFHAWKDSPERVHYTYSPHHVEVGVRVTPQGSAMGAHDNLIQRLNPRDNTNCKRCENPF